MVVVRVWQPADLPELERMAERVAWGITPADDRLYTTYETVAALARQNLYNVLNAPYGTAFVAEADGRPVGFVLMALQPQDRTGELRGYLADIWVEPEYRGTGVSRLLAQKGDEYLHSLGVREVTIWTHAHNAAAGQMAGRLGFLPWGVMMVKQL